MCALRVACTIMGRIVAGHPNKENTGFKGEPVDVTSDCVKAIVEKIGIGKTLPIVVDGVPKYEIEIREIPESTEPAAG